MGHRSAFSLLLLLTACDSSTPPDVDAAVEDVVDATADVAVLFCECALESRGDDPGACEDAAQEVLGTETQQCVRGLVEGDDEAFEVMRCNTEALRGLVECFDSAGVCPEVVARAGEGDGDREDEPISEDACGLAFEDEIDACGALPAETEEALQACLTTRATNEACLGDDCE